MKKLVKILAGLLILVVVLGVWLFAFGGYMPWTYHVTHAKPEVVGTRLNSQGQLVEKVFRRVNTSSVGVLMTPEGPKNATKYKVEYLLQQSDHPLALLPFLSDQDFKYFARTENDVHSDLQFCDQFLPVTNSPLWIAAGSDPVGNNFGGSDFHVVVFDPSHLLSERTFNLKMDYEHPGQQFEFGDGNRTLRLTTALGLVQKYDVLHDQVTDLRKGMR